MKPLPSSAKPFFLSKLTLIGILFLSLLQFSLSLNAQSSICVNFSPYYKQGQDPRRGSNISKAQIIQGLEAVKPYCNCIRTFASGSPLDSIPYIAREMGFETIIVGMWLDRDTSTNRIEIETGIKLAQNGLADRLIVGSETGLRNELSTSLWVEYINYVKSKVPDIPVSSADVYGILIDNPEVMEAVDFLFFNAYPYWEGANIDCALYQFNEMFKAIQQVAGDKEIIVSETGWPTDGNTVGQAVPSLTNLQDYLRYLLAWKEHHNTQITWFSAFDEPWKYSSRNPQEAYWGLFSYDPALDSLILKPGIHDILTQSPVIDTTVWSCRFIENEVDSARITFTQIPTYGDQNGIICGRVDGVRPCDYNLAMYIKVNGRWWVKPTYAHKKIKISCDGTFCIDVVTGGLDRNATEYQLFLVDKAFDPPGIGNAPIIPDSLYEIAVTHEVVRRTPFDYGMLITEELNRVIKRGDTLSIPIKVINFDTILHSTGTIYSGDRSLKLINVYSDNYPDILSLSIIDSTNMIFELDSGGASLSIPDSTVLFTIQLLIGEGASYCRGVNFLDKYSPLQTTHFVDNQPQIVNTIARNHAVICPTVPLKLFFDPVQEADIRSDGTFAVKVRSKDFIKIMAFDIALLADPGIKILDMEEVDLTHGYDYRIYGDSMLTFSYDIRDTNVIYRSDNRELFTFKAMIIEDSPDCKQIRFSTDSLYRKSIQVVRFDTTILQLQVPDSLNVCRTTVSLRELSNDYDIVVFPNPVSSNQKLHIKIDSKLPYNNPERLRINVLDVLGKKVWAATVTNSERYEKSIQLVPAAYIIQISGSKGRVYVEKILVQ